MHLPLEEPDDFILESWWDHYFVIVVAVAFFPASSLERRAIDRDEPVSQERALSRELCPNSPVVFLHEGDAVRDFEAGFLQCACLLDLNVACFELLRINLTLHVPRPQGHSLHAWDPFGPDEKKTSGLPGGLSYFRVVL